MPMRFCFLTLLGDGLFGQLSEDGELEIHVLAHFDHHEDPGAEDDEVQQARDGVVHVWPESIVEEWSQYPVDDEPRHEQVKALEGVESDIVVPLEPRRGKYDNRGDPAADGDVAKQRCGPRGDAADVLRGGAGATPAAGLRTTACVAVGGCVCTAVTSFDARRLL